MTPLSHEAYWERIISHKEWRYVGNEDLMQSVLTRTPKTRVDIFEAVHEEISVRVERIGRGAIHRTDPNKKTYIRYAVDRVELAIAQGVGPDAAILSLHFACVIAGWVRGQRTMNARRGGLMKVHGTAILTPGQLAPSQESVDIAMEFHRMMPTLPPQVQEVIRLRGENLTNVEVGLLMGVSESTIRRWLEATGLRGLLAA